MLVIAAELSYSAHLLYFRTHLERRDPDMDDLFAQLKDITDRQPYSVAWYLKNLATGEVLVHEADELVATRSTRKVAIMMSLLKAVNEGKFDLTQLIQIPDKYQHTNSGVTQFFLPEPTLRLRDAMTLMMVVSDNACTGTIADMLTLEYINAFCQSIGLHNTVHRFTIPQPTTDMSVNTVSTPREQGMLLDMILKGSQDSHVAAKMGCTSEACQLAIKTMMGQRLKTKLPALLPPGAVVAHKGGTGPGMHSDTGIVYKGQMPLFIMCAYTWGVPEAMADGTPGAAAAALYTAKMSRTAYLAIEQATSGKALRRAP